MNSLKQLLNDFSAFPEIPERENESPGLLEIAGCPHEENVWSNLLAFYLNPGREHRLGNLMLNALLEAAKRNTPEAHGACPRQLSLSPQSSSVLNRITVDREYQTDTGRYIDIVVRSDTFVLGIENKVNSALYNDLADYAATLDRLAGTGKEVIKIVLSKYPQRDPGGGFVNVLYADLLPAVRKRLGLCAGYADTRYLIFLIDFLNHIENILNVNIMTDNSELRKFIIENEDEIVRLSELYGKFRVCGEQKLRRVWALMQTKMLEEKYTTDGRSLTLTKNFDVDKSDGGKTLIAFWNIEFGDLHLEMQAYIQRGYNSLLAHFAFRKGMEYPAIKRELDEKGLWMRPAYENFLDSDENEIASDLQSQLDDALAYLAERNTTTQL
ncbi:MAG: PD-(D/E)XK nuclease family protein [Tannerella sp.]|jgi:hypothetical protein|nr:PD-(D/E)XK nuclease family protein [Tannerella sp.]